MLFKFAESWYTLLRQFVPEIHVSLEASLSDFVGVMVHFCLLIYEKMSSEDTLWAPISTDLNMMSMETPVR